MNSLACALMVLLLVPQAVGEVESQFDKKADFSALKTYAWSLGHDAYDARAHKAIVADIEAQMTALGFSKAPSASADVFLTYFTVRASEVDLKKLDQLKKEQKDPAGATRILGRLAVLVSRPSSRETLWSAVTRRRLSEDPAQWEGELKSAVAALFATYPGKKKAG
jgi:hypothetical protein